jgi:hypothetical protein
MRDDDPVPRHATPRHSRRYPAGVEGEDDQLGMFGVEFGDLKRSQIIVSAGSTG